MLCRPWKVWNNPVWPDTHTWPHILPWISVCVCVCVCVVVRRVKTHLVHQRRKAGGLFSFICYAQSHTHTHTLSSPSSPEQKGDRLLCSSHTHTHTHTSKPPPSVEGDVIPWPPLNEQHYQHENVQNNVSKASKNIFLSCWMENKMRIDVRVCIQYNSDCWLCLDLSAVCCLSAVCLSVCLSVCLWLCVSQLFSQDHRLQSVYILFALCV